MITNTPLRGQEKGAASVCLAASVTENVTFSELDDNLVRKVLNCGFMVRLSLGVSN